MQIYCWEWCQPNLSLHGFHTRWDFDSETSRFTPRQNKTGSFESKVMSFFKRRRRECEIESFFTTGRQKTIDCFIVDGFCSDCKTRLEAAVGFYHLYTCQELRPSLTEEDIQRGCMNRESSMHWDDTIYKWKALRLLKCGSANGGYCTKRSILLNNISDNTFITGVHLQLRNF